MNLTSRFFTRAALAAVLFLPLAASAVNLLEMSDRLDKVDQQDFSDAVGKAKRCTQSHDFSCAEDELKKAGKLTTSVADRKSLDAARQDLASAKRRVEESRLAAERARLAERSRYSTTTTSRSGEFSIWPNMPKDEGRYNTWQASCAEGGYAWVNVQHDQPGVYCWGAGGFSSAGAGCAGIGIEAALKKACRGD
jgi:hypothetical protein